jgi:PAS domain-containing protein
VRVIWQTHQGEELPGGQFPLGKGVTSQVLRTGEPQLIRHWSAQAPPIQVQYATERPELPESAMVVPVVFNDEVRGVLSVQHYEPHAFDAEDLALLQDIAHQIAPALLTALDARAGCGDAPGNPLALEALVAALPDGVLVVDRRARLVGLNRAARRLLCLDTSSLVLGHPVDQRQGERWPLGTHRVTEQVRPLIAQLKRGANPDADVEVTLPAPETTVFLRYTGDPGVNNLRIYAHCVEDTPSARPPVTITHAWRDGGELKTRTVTLQKPGPYNVTVEGDPVDEYVELSVPSGARP